MNLGFRKKHRYTLGFESSLNQRIITRLAPIKNLLCDNIIYNNNEFIQIHIDFDKWNY